MPISNMNLLRELQNHMLPLAAEAGRGWELGKNPGRKNNRPRVLGPELDWSRPMRRPEFLRFPNLRNLTCADLHQLEACYLTSPDGGSELPCQPDPRHPLSSAKVCRPCWRGPACARRARLPACEMAPCKLPRYVHSAVWCRARRHPRPHRMTASTTTPARPIAPATPPRPSSRPRDCLLCPCRS